MNRPQLYWTLARLPREVLNVMEEAVREEPAICAFTWTASNHKEIGCLYEATQRRLGHGALGVALADNRSEIARHFDIWALRAHMTLKSPEYKNDSVRHTEKGKERLLAMIADAREQS